ncbi:enoyl-CoA hydratase [Paenibacillus cremeus]|uniref:Enoyl-CoA hydratase n=1 Tax=Paenibacillus cremeus TaxID=2163881 RepID=A0A559K900_9BACL|nr:enoyl-CoA hydratase [Paenibacillus cremeus]TVY08609.1 enoyl-CoA hydratase [Paenibacillus cremeus]
MDQLVLRSVNEQGVAVIALNRPQAANALSMQLLSELQASLAECRADASVRCVVITGAGSSFCAGADLKERFTMNESEVREAVALIRATVNAVEALPMPVIAAINGAAFGGGLELALACDLRIMAETAKVGLTETALGIIPGAGGTQRLPRLIGVGRAKELIFTARRVEAEEALQIGLVEQVAPAGRSVLDQALEVAGRIARNAPIAVAQAKLAINQGLSERLSAGLGIERQAYKVTIPTKDRLEGLQAFREKRDPNFKGE